MSTLNSILNTPSSAPSSASSNTGSGLVPGATPDAVLAWHLTHDFHTWVVQRRTETANRAMQLRRYCQELRPLAEAAWGKDQECVCEAARVEDVREQFSSAVVEMFCAEDDLRVFDSYYLEALSNTHEERVKARPDVRLLWEWYQAEQAQAQSQDD